MVDEQKMLEALHNKTIVRQYFNSLNLVVPFALKTGCNEHDALNITYLLYQDQFLFLEYYNDNPAPRYNPGELHAKMLGDFDETFKRIEAARVALMNFKIEVENKKKNFIELFGE